MSHPCVMQALLSQRHVTHTSNTYKSAPRLLTSCCAGLVCWGALPNTALQHAQQSKSSPCCDLGPPQAGHHPHLKPCRTHSHFLILEFLPGCWFHHHARKPCVCSAKHQCQLFPGPLINLIICPLGSAEISAPILPCQACPSFAACWRRPLW